ncbi:outer membrane protein assembly factor BamB family protein [Urbifossiella limnaea]|uniref:Outer membrane biogenesis protein BamB n=1 Tax=Urbifossiella limnaea TaxID=2528023 RepID=A0A517XYB7_9BACT|nr:PQQ-binding-like beta-propeller repeat protein [Urbifossiella limnaea]QDU22492.1 outer membrane biogenesis protein BamB [Urbifossiella limnaea]
MLTRLPLAAIAAALLTAPVAADNWPQWRGVKNDGHAAGPAPTEWGPDKNVVWKVKLPGRGSSTPCVWEDKIFITSLDAAGTSLLCFGADGVEKWKASLGGPSGRGGRGDEGNDASASCSTDGKHVWAFAGNMKLACFDMAGRETWSVDLDKYGKVGTRGIQFGIHWTPVLYKDKLFLQVMHKNAQKVVALDAATGKELWAVERPGYSKGESPDVYASAFVWEGPGGEALLVAHGNDYCTGHRLDTGAEVWRVAGLNPTTNGAWRFVSCPLVTPDLILVPSCKNGPLVAFNPVGATGSISPGNPAEKWRHKETPDVVSPLRVGNIVYTLNSDNGGLTALDAGTGKQLYRQSLPAKQIYRGNMVHADGKILIVGREGVGFVIQAGPEFKVLATNDLKEKVYASPAVANGRLYVRTWDHLYCFGAK